MFDRCLKKGLGKIMRQIFNDVDCLSKGNISFDTIVSKGNENQRVLDSIDVWKIALEKLWDNYWLTKQLL